MSERASPLAVLERFTRSLNDHDIDALLSCFHPDYESEQPAHPQRSFKGRDHVYRNWSWVFDSFRDFRADMLDFTIDSSAIWSEWRWTGTHPEGKSFEVRGVMILEVEDGAFRRGRLYLEPLDGS